MASISTSPGRERFGADAELYDRARPGYPPALFDWLSRACALGPDAVCFEIGAGTGQATLPILAAPVASILAIEPDANLAGFLEARADAGQRLSVVRRRFEDVDLPAGAFDFGFAATSFHWLKRMRGLKACLGALKPGGAFAMWWNVYHDPANPDAFDRATAHMFDGLEEDAAKTSSGPAFALDIASRTGEMRAAGFAGVEARRFEWVEAFTPDRLAELYSTFSRVGMAPAGARDRLLNEVRRVAISDFGGMVERRIVTSAFVGVRPARNPGS